MADNLLDKASILLTPTAYNDGSMLSIKPENGDGDFTFSRSSAATRVNAQGLVENVQIISSELVSNGNFSQIGTEEVSNGSFSQEGSEEIVNGSFDTDSNWVKQTGWSINGGTANTDGTPSSEIRQNNVTTVGKQYKYSFTISNSGGGVLNARLRNKSTGSPILNFSNEGTYSGTFTSNGTFIDFVTLSNNTASFSIDNVSVKEVGQDWTLGTGWSIGDGVAKSIQTSTNNYLQQTISALSNNKLYRVTFDLDIISATTTTIGISNTGAFGNLSSSERFFTTSGTKTFDAIYSNSFPNYIRFVGGMGTEFTISNVSVKEVGQDWVFGGSGSNKATIGDNSATITSVDGNSYLQQNSVLTSGKNYKISYEIISSSASTNVLKLISSFGISEIPTSVGTHIVYGIATSSTLYIERRINGVNVTITNISVKEITDDTDLPRINYEGFSYQDSLGSEEVVNGDFSNGSANWENYTSGSSTIVFTDVATLNVDASNSNVGIYQENVFASGKQYKVVLRIKASSSFDAEVLETQGAATVSTIGSVSLTTSYQDFTFYFTGTGTNDIFIHRKYGSSSANQSITIDNVSVKEYLGQEVVPDSGCGSWLMESQSTNLITQSELFSDASWGKQATIVDANSIISADGTQNASKIQSTQTGSAFVSISYPTLTVGNTYTFSCFAKKGNNDWIRLAHISSGGTGCWFDLENGVVGTVNSQSATIEDYGNGWYKCTNTFIATASTDANLVFIGICDADGSTNAGAIGQNNYLWGAMLEQQSFSTSYIPTSGAASTRLQDIATNSGNSTLINSTEGTLYAEIAALADDSTNRQITLSDGTNDNRIVLKYDNQSNIIQSFNRVGNVETAFLGATVSDITQFSKIAIKFKQNDYALWIDGVEVDTDNSSTTYAANTLNDLSFGVSSNFYGKNKALAVYKEALTDANLRSLTYPNPVATTFDLDFDTIAEQFTFTRGSEATFVNAQGLIESTASNDAPRIDYSTGAKAFLLEPQSTNLITQSELFSDSSWVKNGFGNALAPVVTLNSNISPDGTQNASRIEMDCTSTLSSDYSAMYQQLALDGSSDYTISFYVKSNTSSEQDLLFFSNSSFSTQITANSEWQRVESTFTSNSTNARNFGLVARGSVQQDVDVLIYGAMLENQSYSTSYIPTSGASATRNQELCNNATPVINSEEGTLYAEISAFGNGGVDRNISLNDNTPSNYVQLIFHATDNRIVFRVNSGGVAQVNIDDYTFEQTDNLKIACVYKQNNFSLWINGIERATDFSGNIPIGLSKLDFSLFNGTQPFFGNTKGLKYYPKALADVQLEDLTTI